LLKDGDVFRPIVVEEATPEESTPQEATPEEAPPNEATPDSDSEGTASEYGISPEETTSDPPAILEEDPVPTLNQRVISYTSKQNIRMVRRKRGKAVIYYNLYEVAILQIPVKLRFGAEVHRLPVRIIEIHEKGYKLVYEYSKLIYLYSSKVLNKLASQSIYTHLPTTGRSKISLNKAIQKINRRETISTSQKARRKANKRKGNTIAEVLLAKRAVVRGKGDDATGGVEVGIGVSGNGMTTRARASKDKVV
jgi:hypothetical protein